MTLELTPFFVFLSLCNVQSLLVKPVARCVPTEIVKGPCHKCVCSEDGVFLCHVTQQCQQSGVNPRKSNKGECQPHVTYKYEELSCTCNYEGKWLTFNCRGTFQYLRPEKTTAKRNIRSNYSITCTPNSLLLIDCNICQCDNSGVIQPSLCTNRQCSTNGHKSDLCKFGDFLRTNNEICVCSDINFYIDRLCVKVGEETMQELNRSDIALITNLNQNRKNMEKDTCVPLQEYIIDCNSCVCDKNRELVCTNKVCDAQVNTLRFWDKREDFYKLPLAKHKRQDCVPGQTYRDKCNSCVCNNERKLTCTTMICFEDFV